MVNIEGNFRSKHCQKAAPEASTAQLAPRGAAVPISRLAIQRDVNIAAKQGLIRFFVPQAKQKHPKYRREAQSGCGSWVKLCA
jgi:hypothetical protein